MYEITIDQIKEKAEELAKEGKSWHFHILTPQCQLNDQDRFAFILENAEDSEVFITYSDEALMSLGKKLFPLLHNDVLKEGDDDQSRPSPEGKKIIQRAKELTAKGQLWHHHVLFPDCIYNDSKKWMILFEDQENQKTLKAVSDQEPKGDLKEIETLYYKQKKIE